MHLGINCSHTPRLSPSPLVTWLRSGCYPCLQAGKRKPPLQAHYPSPALARSLAGYGWEKTTQRTETPRIVMPGVLGRLLGRRSKLNKPKRQRGWKAALEFPSESPRPATSPMAKKPAPRPSSPAFAPSLQKQPQKETRRLLSHRSRHRWNTHPEDFGSATGERQILYTSPSWLQESPSFIRPSAGILHTPSGKAQSPSPAQSPGDKAASPPPHTHFLLIAKPHFNPPQARGRPPVEEATRPGSEELRLPCKLFHWEETSIPHWRPATSSPPLAWGNALTAPGKSRRARLLLRVSLAFLQLTLSSRPPFWSLSGFKVGTSLLKELEPVRQARSHLGLVVYQFPHQRDTRLEKPLRLALPRLSSLTPQCPLGFVVTKQ